MQAAVVSNCLICNNLVGLDAPAVCTVCIPVVDCIVVQDTHAHACEKGCKGWDLFNVSSEGSEIQRCDACARFSSDAAAGAHCVRLAFSPAAVACPVRALTSDHMRHYAASYHEGCVKAVSHSLDSIPLWDDRRVDLHARYTHHTDCMHRALRGW